ncbi:MAG: fumarylacetoacetate hydrolase family protein [Myxococcota bacterium]
MKLGTLRNGTRDGQLIVVNHQGTHFAAAESGLSLQQALDDWDEHHPRLEKLSEDLRHGSIEGDPVPFESLCAPLPRAYEWIDGSAYLNHVRLVRKARGAEPPPTLETDPLVYQGGSGVLLGPRDPVTLGDPTWGLDFEGEICVILGDTPEATKAADADPFIRLVTICNDVSLRGLIPPELAKGFGFFQSKPATAFAPFAVTPDELGDSWREGRLHLPLNVHLNDVEVGHADAGPEMHFSFWQLIEHVTRTRALRRPWLASSARRVASALSRMIASNALAARVSAAS